MNKEKQKSNRELLAKAVFCRSFLYFVDFITEKEAEMIFTRIKKWQDKHKVSISPEQINSIEIMYDDNSGS